MEVSISRDFPLRVGRLILLRPAAFLSFLLLHALPLLLLPLLELLALLRLLLLELLVLQPLLLGLAGLLAALLLLLMSLLESLALLLLLLQKLLLLLLMRLLELYLARALFFLRRSALIGRRLFRAALRLDGGRRLVGGRIGLPPAAGSVGTIPPVVAPDVLSASP